MCGTIRSLPTKDTFRHSLKVLLIAAGLSSCAPDIPAGDPVPMQYGDSSLFLSAIKQDASVPLKERITGITVPHHLLARDLIAQTFGLISANEYDRVLLLSPDHFFLGDTDVTVSTQPFDTVFGILKADTGVAKALAKIPVVGTGSFFYREHGINALTPFIKHHFPDASFAAITFKGNSTREDLDKIARALKPLLAGRTLVVQSTDYSHFLSPRDAKKKDQETLRIIAGGDPDRLFGLNQPGHMDAINAQWLQSVLQKDVHGASPLVIRNRNSQEYAGENIAETTSYVTQIYSPDVLPAQGDGHYVFAGDTILGRGMADFANDSARRGEFVRNILSLTGGAPMIVNLEGVMMDNCPKTDSVWVLCMDTEPTLRILKDLNVIAVSTANNHAYDLGKTAYADMVRVLQRNGIRVLERNATLEFSQFRLTGFTDIENSPDPKAGLLYESDIKRMASSTDATPLPSFAFIHWGDEYSNTLNDRQKALAGIFRENGVELVIGAHSHHSVPLQCDALQCMAASLGNFIFDQEGPDVSGQLLDVQFFPQGTYALRTIEL